MNLRETPIKETIKAARKRARLTQKALAEMAGVPFRTLQDIEYGTVKRPSYGIVAKILSVLSKELGETIGPQPEASEILASQSEGLNSDVFEELKDTIKNIQSSTPARRHAPNLSSQIELLVRLDSLSSDRKALVWMLIFDDVSYLADNPDLARVASLLLKAYKPRL